MIVLEFWFIESLEIESLEKEKEEKKELGSFQMEFGTERASLG